jgi:hypothetical protein
MDPAIVNALAGTSGLIGLLALLAYFFYAYQVRRLDQSVRRTIEGEAPGMFNADKVVEILRTFETPETRLEALKQLTGVDKRSRSCTKVTMGLAGFVAILTFCHDNEIVNPAHAVHEPRHSVRAVNPSRCSQSEHG